MSKFEKIIASIIILGWMYLNLHVFFPLIIKFTSNFRSIISVIISLFVIGFLAKMNSAIGQEYRSTLIKKYDASDVLGLASLLLIPSIILVGYSIIGGWFSFLDFGWEHLKISWLNKLIFTIFCFSTLSIPSKISGIK